MYLVHDIFGERLSRKNGKILCHGVVSPGIVGLTDGRFGGSGLGIFGRFVSALAGRKILRIG